MGGGRLQEVIAHGGSTVHWLAGFSRGSLGTFCFVLFLFLF